MKPYDKYTYSLVKCSASPKLNGWRVSGTPSYSKKNSKFNLAFQADGTSFLEYEKYIKLSGDFSVDFYLTCTESAKGSIFLFESSTPLNLNVSDLNLSFECAGICQDFIIAEGFSLTENSVNHVAICFNKDSSRFRFYLNGIRAGSVIAKVPSGQDFLLTIGKDLSGVSLSEFRVSSIRRWKADFIKKDEEEFPDENSIVFLKFKTSLEDECSNGLSWIAEEGKVTGYSYYSLLNASSSPIPFENQKKALLMEGKGLLRADRDINIKGSYCTELFIRPKERLGTAIRLEGLIEIRIEGNGYSITDEYRGCKKELTGYDRGWTHLAIVNNVLEDIEEVYINGKKEYESEGAKDFSGRIEIGRGFKGYIKGIRISEGVPRYVQDFVINLDDIEIWMKENYSDFSDRGTVALLHFNDSAIRDEMGNIWELADESVHYTSKGSYRRYGVEMYRDRQYLESGIIKIRETFEIGIKANIIVDGEYDLGIEGTIFQIKSTDGSRMIRLGVNSLAKLFEIDCRAYDNSRRYFLEGISFNRIHDFKIRYEAGEITVKTDGEIKYLTDEEFGDKTFTVPIEMGSGDYRVMVGNDESRKRYVRGVLNDFCLESGGEKLSELRMERNVQQDGAGKIYWRLIEDLKENDGIGDEYREGESRSIEGGGRFKNGLRLNKYQYLELKDEIYLGGREFCIELWMKSEDVKEGIKSTDEEVSMFNQVYLELRGKESYIQVKRSGKTTNRLIILKDSEGRERREELLGEDGYWLSGR